MVKTDYNCIKNAILKYYKMRVYLYPGTLPVCFQVEPILQAYAHISSNILGCAHAPYQLNYHTVIQRLQS